MYASYISLGGSQDREVRCVPIGPLASSLDLPPEIIPFVFNALDADNSGGLNFKEFTLGLCEFCGEEEGSLTRLAFRMFTKHRPDTINLEKDLSPLLRMTFTSDNSFKAQQEKLLVEAGTSVVGLLGFHKLMGKFKGLMMPVFHVRQRLRGLLPSSPFWRGLQKQRGLAGLKNWWSNLDKVRARLNNWFWGGNGEFLIPRPGTAVPLVPIPGPRQFGEQGEVAGADFDMPLKSGRWVAPQFKGRKKWLFNVQEGAVLEAPASPPTHFISPTTSIDAGLYQGARVSSEVLRLIAKLDSEFLGKGGRKYK